MVPPFLTGLLQELGEIMGGGLYLPKLTAIYLPPRVLLPDQGGAEFPSPESEDAEGAEN